MFESREIRLAGISRVMSTARAKMQIPLLWAEVMAIRLSDQVGGVGFGVRKAWESDDNFEYCAAIEIAGTNALPPNLKRIDIPPACYAIFTPFDHVVDLRQAWPVIIGEWLPRSTMQLAMSPSFERYGEDFDPLSGRGEMAIWLAVLPGKR